MAAFSEERPAYTPTKIGSAGFLVPARQQHTELLDQGVGTLDDVRENLCEMWQANRTFGGVQALIHHLHPLLQKPSQLIRIADLGTGSGRLALELMTWAQRHQLRLQVYPVDLAARHLTIARENINGHAGINIIQADALALPFLPGQIDYFVSSLFMHHFEPDMLKTLLRDLYQRARRGLVMNDLIRGTLPLIGFRAVQPLFARHYLTRHDGILSILRAYTPAELLSLAQDAGLKNARVYRDFPFRMTMTLIAEKDHV